MMNGVSRKRLRIALIGCGAIGRTVLELIRFNTSLEIPFIVTAANNETSVASFIQSIGVDANIRPVLPDSSVDILVEVAGHSAVVQHVLPALRQGIHCIVTSVGALSIQGITSEIEAAARSGNTQVEMVSGAIGAIDALAAARVAGLHFVRYSGRKPPLSWQGTSAETLYDLSALKEETIIFNGNAREAALLYPKNANVAATVALAGLGLDETQVRLIADPFVKQNTHVLEVEGAFGSFELAMRNARIPGNTKSSALAAYSVVRALDRHIDHMIL